MQEQKTTDMTGRYPYIKLMVMSLIMTIPGIGLMYSSVEDGIISPAVSCFTKAETVPDPGPDVELDEIAAAIPAESDNNNVIILNTAGESPSVSYKQIVHERAHDYRIEPSLVSALITIESNWDPEAISHRGAIGLMQLMPDTAREMGVQDPFNPVENIEGGIRYLRYLMDRFDDNITLAVAAYNAGPTSIETYQDIPPFRETRRYVERVLTLYHSDDSNEI